MSKRETNILDAAIRVFTRYGVKRTSMGDIAEEAGISRQTLYKAFKSKDDILRTHIKLYTEQAIANIEANLSKTDKLEGQLNLVLENMIVPGFDMVRASPNAEDIIEGVNAATREELEETAAQFQAIILKLLMPYEKHLIAAGTAPDNLAELVQQSARAAKDYARDRQHLLITLKTISQLVLRAANQ